MLTNNIQVGDEEEEDDDLRMENRQNSSSYRGCITECDVKYFFSTMKCDREELLWNERTQTFHEQKNLKFLSKLINVHVLAKILCEYELIDPFMNNFRRNIKGIFGYV